MGVIKFIVGKLLLHVPIVKYKVFVYKILGVKFVPPIIQNHIGDSKKTIRLNCFVGSPTVVGSYNNIIMHDDSSIERGGFIVANDRIEIGTGAAIAYGVTILTSADPRTKLRKLYPKMTAPVVIGDYCWIGARSTILPGLTIGEGSVVAAGSVVTKDVPPHCLVAGVPAVVKKEFDL